MHAWLLSAVHQFQPSWYSSVTGTNVVGALIAGFPYDAPAKNAIGWAFWWLGLVLFCVFSVLQVLKFLCFPQMVTSLFRHPVQSMFMGLIPIALSTVLNGFPAYLLPRWSPDAVNGAAAVLWGVDCGMAAVCTLVLPFYMFTRQKHSWANMTAVWLLPVLPGVTAAATGGLLAMHCGGATARKILRASVYMWGASVPLSLMVIGLYLGRLAVYKLPPRELVVSCFLPVGPLAKGAVALLYMGTAAVRTWAEGGGSGGAGGDVAAAALEGDTLLVFGPGFQQAGVFMALALWGAAGWWLIMAIVSASTTIRQLPYSMGWWGFVFPLGVFAQATVELAGDTRLESSSYLVFGAALSVLSLLLWCLVAAWTLAHAWRAWQSGALLEAPDLGLLREEEEGRRQGQACTAVGPVTPDGHAAAVAAAGEGAAAYGRAASAVAADEKLADLGEVSILKLGQGDLEAELGLAHA